MIIGELVLKRKTRTPIRKKIEEEIRPTNPYTFSMRPLKEKTKRLKNESC
jgi:hypothetical protein